MLEKRASGGSDVRVVVCEGVREVRGAAVRGSVGVRVRSCPCQGREGANSCQRGRPASCLHKSDKDEKYAREKKNGSKYKSHQYVRRRAECYPR